METREYTLMDGESLAYPVSEFERTNIARFSKSRINHLKLDDNATYPEANGAQLYQALKADILESVALDDEMMALRSGTFDRVRWEQKAAEIVSAVVDTEPLLHNYRTQGYWKLGDKYYNFYEKDMALKDNPGAKEEDLVRVTSVEEQDLTMLSEDDEIDCDKFAAIKGLLLYEIDHTYLNPNDPDPAKRPQEYYLAAGETTMGYHAYVISSATGNVIEATQDYNSYVKKNDPNYSFRDFLAGVPFRGYYTDEDGKPIAGLEYTITTGDFNQDVYFRRRAAIMAGNNDDLDQHVTSGKVLHGETLKAFDQQIYLSTSCDAKDVTVSLTPVGDYFYECPESVFKRE